MDKKLPESTNLGVEIMNSINDKQRGNLVTWYKFVFTVWRKRDVFKNLSNISLKSPAQGMRSMPNTSFKNFSS